MHAAGLEEVDPVGEEGDEAGDVETGPDVGEVGPFLDCYFSSLGLVVSIRNSFKILEF